ncbi:tautomerase family protein [Thetidibacter halocola]|uniref:Tautomerase family protein n=1 Tax=Thetidibacter halocola TaxID=2827239 RepID=A0A8J7WEN1_9RHOB|nr:tautomerase family protein [Thetidibacter halocola]
MPIVELHLLQGYDDGVKARLGKGLTDAVRFVLPAAPEAVTVMVHEMAAANYYRGGEMRQPAPALPDPTRIVHDYLSAMERRDLPAAQAMLAEGFTMQFPGAAPMTTLEELIAWSKPRYAFVRKTYERFDAMPGNGGAIVYCFGTLHGEWLDGTAFEGIRFIDRFEIAGGKLIRQDVWNDMAEAKAQA